MPKSKSFPPAEPHLPTDFLQNLQGDKTSPHGSLAFLPEFNHYRHQIVTGEVHAELEIPPGHFNRLAQMAGVSVPASASAARMSWLHLAALCGDLPLAHELLRLGTSVSVKDITGRSPLYAGLKMLSVSFHQGRQTTEPKVKADTIRRITRVCILLVEQYSDVNEMHDGIALIHLACIARSWDLIRLLLIHGANATPSGLPASKHPLMSLKTPAEKKRFLSFIPDPSCPPLRPPRPCPCWSGKNLRECHADGTKPERPYPDNFICKCKSRKTFEKCCKKKGIMYTERWDEEQLWIMPSTVLDVPMNWSDPAVAELSTRILQKFREEYPKAPLITQEGVDVMMRYKAVIIRVLVEQQQIDPAFAFPAIKLDFISRPWSSLVTKVNAKIRIAEWNTLVDEYIASGVDHRSHEDIENEAKLGISGGPLYRECEGDECTNLEGRNSVKLLLCVGCKKAVYCSKSCQQSAWKSHKLACRAGGVQEQMLPSQHAFNEAYQQFLEIMTRKSGVHLGNDAIS